MPPLAAVDQYLPRPIDELTPPPSTSTLAYAWPTKGTLTSGFGMRWGRPHKGIDIANSTGTPIYASADGVVEKAGWNNGGYGNLVDIRHPDGSLTRYGHNSKILVQVGQHVHKGEIITAMGTTGNSTGPHCHFEVHPPGKGAVNPIAFLPQRL
jgi:murein DD-endopeptidase MepM/ murein hydrolase activator NlpD